MYACMNIDSFNIDLYTYLYCLYTCCMDLHICLYEYHLLFIELYKYICRFHTCCMDFHVCSYEYQSFSHGFIYMFVLLPYLLHGFTWMLYQSFFNLICIHVCIVSILVAWIYMYVCMNNIDLHTYLCCFLIVCMDVHVCLYEFQ